MTKPTPKTTPADTDHPDPAGVFRLTKINAKQRVAYDTHLNLIMYQDGISRSNAARVAYQEGDAGLKARLQN